MGNGREDSWVLAGLIHLSLLLAISQVQWGGDWGGDGRDLVGRILSSCRGPLCPPPRSLEKGGLGTYTDMGLFFNIFKKEINATS